MNGSGKPGLTIDSTGAADFEAQVGAEVHLSVGSPSGQVALASVAYDSAPVDTQENHFRLKILAGIRLLRIAVHRGVPPSRVELRESGQSTLATFESDTAVFRIRGR